MKPTSALSIRVLALVLAVAAAPAAAHDTWFERIAAGGLQLGTGNRFPIAETPVDAQYLVARHCLAADGQRVDLDTDATRLHPRGNAATCLVQLQPFELELPPDKVAVYFRESRPTAAIRQAWAVLHSRGEAFRERYTKFARIELDPRGAALPSGAAMDVVRVAPTGALAQGNDAVFQVLRDGEAFAGFAVELVNEASPIGLWLQTDAQGRVRARLPLAGRWLLRGTDIRRSTREDAAFESRFITYAFDVAAQNPSTLTSNARSTSQMPATAAIASDPATITQRR